MLASLSPALDLRPSRADRRRAARPRGRQRGDRPRTTVALALAGAPSLVADHGARAGRPGPHDRRRRRARADARCARSRACSPCSPARCAGPASGSAASALIVVVSELRATTTRAVALAGIAALAVYGSVAIGGARDDLLRGLDANFGEYLQTARHLGDDGRQRPHDQLVRRRRRAASRSPALPVCARCAPTRAASSTSATRRMWMIARPAGDDAADPRQPAAQRRLGHADSAAAQRRLGDRLRGLRRRTPPARRRRASRCRRPSGPARLARRRDHDQPRLGAGRGDPRRRGLQRATGRATDPTALEVDLAPGRRGRGRRAARCGARSATGRASACRRFAERQRQYAADSRQGLQALSEIATLLLIAAALAVASALSAAIWQRRARLASLKIQGYDTAQLWRALLLESAIVLGVGCVDRRGCSASTDTRSRAAGCD